MGIVQPQPHDPGRREADWRCPLRSGRPRGEVMNVSGQEIDRTIDRTLEYRSTAVVVKLLPSGLLLIFLGLLILVLADPAPIWTMIPAALCVTFGICVVGLALWRRVRHGKPLLT